MKKVSAYTGSAFPWLYRSTVMCSHLTRNITFELGPMNIRVNAIAPGVTCTPALARVLTPEVEEAMLRHTPLKRLGEPGDMATPHYFCAHRQRVGSVARS